MKKILILILFAAFFAGITCCEKGKAPSEQPSLNNYILKIEGTPGLRVDLLVILKPTTNTIERLVNEEVVLPYSKEFSGVKCAVWLDAPYKGQDGIYKMSLTTVGVGTSSDSGNVTEAIGGSGSLSDL